MSFVIAAEPEYKVLYKYGVPHLLIKLQTKMYEAKEKL